LDDILLSAGLDSSDFYRQGPQMQAPVIRATTDPHAIRRALSSRDTTYAMMAEEPTHTDSVPVSGTVEEVSVREVPPDNGDNLTDSDYDNILADLGFHGESAIDESRQALENAIADMQEASSRNPNVTATVTEVGDDGEEVSMLIDDGEEDDDDDYEEDHEGEEEENNNVAEEPSGSNPSTESAVTVPVGNIRENSPSLLIDETTSRFSGTDWFSEVQKLTVIIAGLGGIGSNLAYQMARLSPASIYLYDNDRVELGNLSGQFYSKTDAGEYKASATADHIHSYTSEQSVFSINGWFTSATPPGDIMMCGFDSMSSRRTFFNSWKRHVEQLPTDRRGRCLFLDGRLSIDTLQVLALTGDNNYRIGKYEKDFLFEDYEAEETVCSMKQTTYLACMIASVMTNIFVNFTANLLSPEIPCDLPFFTEYDARNMLFRTEQ